MVNKIRALAQFIPKGNLGISIATGALVTLGLLLVATRFPDDIYARAIMMSPFMSGFLAGLVYGGVGTRGAGHFLLIGYLSFLLFGLLLIPTMIGLGPSFFRFNIGLVSYFVAIFPPILLAPIFVSIVGTVFGWLAALAIGR